MSFLIVKLSTVLVLGTISSFARDCPKPEPMTPDDRAAAESLNKAGVALTAKGDIEQAVAMFEESVKKYPLDPMSWNNLGLVVSVKLNDPERAIQYFDRAICLQPNFAMAHFSKAFANYRLGKFQEAEKGYLKTLDFDRGFEDARLNLASTYLRQKKFRKANELLVELNDDSPETPHILNNLGASYFYLRNFSAAARVFESISQLQPDNNLARYNLGVVFLHLKKRKEAIDLHRDLATVDSQLARQLYQGIYADKLLFIK